MNWVLEVKDVWGWSKNFSFRDLDKYVWGLCLGLLGFYSGN